MPAIEGREQVEAHDEALGVKADVDARPRFGALSVLGPAREVPIDLRSDQALLEETLVASDLAAQRGLSQDGLPRARRQPVY